MSVSSKVLGTTGYNESPGQNTQQTIYQKLAELLSESDIYSFTVRDSVERAKVKTLFNRNSKFLAKERESACVCVRVCVCVCVCVSEREIEGGDFAFSLLCLSVMPDRGRIFAWLRCIPINLIFKVCAFTVKRFLFPAESFLAI